MIVRLYRKSSHHTYDEEWFNPKLRSGKATSGLDRDEERQAECNLGYNGWDNAYGT